MDVVALDENRGAVARNVGVERLGTPYVAFCDDDTWWEPGSLSRAADAFDACPALAVINARIVTGPDAHDDPIVVELRDSPVPGPDWLPGPALGSFLAGASVVRREAFRSVGGFNARLWLGGEEELLATGAAQHEPREPLQHPRADRLVRSYPSSRRHGAADDQRLHDDEVVTGDEVGDAAEVSPGASASSRRRRPSRRKTSVTCSRRCAR